MEKYFLFETYFFIRGHTSSDEIPVPLIVFGERKKTQECRTIKAVVYRLPDYGIRSNRLKYNLPDKNRGFNAVLA